MAVDGISKWTMTLFAESGRESREYATSLILSVANQQADAERDGRTRLARPNFQARTGTGNN